MNARFACTVTSVWLLALWANGLPSRTLAQVAVDKEVASQEFLVSNAEFDGAAEALRHKGGFVRSFYDRSSPKHWVQVILESRKPGQLATFGPVDETKSPTFTDDDLLAVRKLTRDAPRSSVHLRGGTFTGIGIGHLAGTKIQRLEISGGHFGDQEALALGQLKYLEDLSIDGTRTPAAASAVRRESAYTKWETASGGPQHAGACGSRIQCPSRQTRHWKIRASCDG
jgi:hypothetical protein